MKKMKNSKLRHGFTTGSCAAAAAKAATYMLLTGKKIHKISIITPKGTPFEADIVDIKIGHGEDTAQETKVGLNAVEKTETYVSCAVIKDGGDDPDVTTGAHICAEVSLIPKAKGLNAEAVTENPHIDNEGQIVIEGGKGVGKVTLPGLDQPVGEAAINHIPREMIKNAVNEIRELCDCHEGIKVVISVPEGEKIAKKTFNPKLGVVGGISIIGTSGIVEPMSEQALKDTILVEFRQLKALGAETAIVVPGNYGLEFLKNTCGMDIDRCVKCSNFIGDTVDMAIQTGFRQMLLVGHIGKLIKVSGGIMNTHSKYGDHRMGLMRDAALKAGANKETADGLLAAVTTEEAVERLAKAGEIPDKEGIKSGNAGILEKTGAKLSNTGILEKTMEVIMERIIYHLNLRSEGRIHIECIMYSNRQGLLAKSPGADELLFNSALRSGFRSGFRSGLKLT